MSKGGGGAAAVGLKRSPEHDHFRDILEQHLKAKLAAEQMSLGDLSQHLFGNRTSQKNYLFRATHADWGFAVPEGLHKLLNWLNLEPRDFAQDPHPGRPGDLEKAVLCYRGLPHQQRVQLLEICRAFVKAAAHEES